MPWQTQGEPRGIGPQGFRGPAMISPDGKMASMGYAPADDGDTDVAGRPGSCALAATRRAA